MIEFTVIGQPVAKARPRLGKWATYTPDKTVNYENLVKYSFIEQCRDVKPLAGPLVVEIKFYMQIPKSTSKKQKALMEMNIERPTKRPDMDNCIKSITDALNGMAYIDDSQIVELSGCKIYSYEPRTEVTIKEIKEVNQ